MRMAVCISGQMRTYRKACDSVLRNVILPNNADVFVHTWEKTGNTNKLVLFLPRGFHFHLPSEYWHSEPDVFGMETCRFEEDLPGLYNAIQELAQTNDVVDELELMELYRAKQVIVEPFDSEFFNSILNLDKIRNRFADGVELNAAPMFYKISQCDALRRAYERQQNMRYDIVLRIRPDLYFGSVLDTSLAYHPGRLSTLYNPYYDILGIADELSNDTMFAGDSFTMTYASSTWIHLAKYWSPDFLPEWQFNKRGPERILRRHLAERGLDGDILKLNDPPIRIVTGMTFEDLVRHLSGDLQKQKALPHFIKSSIGICQSIAAIDWFLAGNRDRAVKLLSRPIEIGDYVCAEPYAGRAKLAYLLGNTIEVERWIPLACEARQQDAFPELFDKSC